MPDLAPDVLVVGSVNRDHVVTADAFPAPGETVHGHDARSSVGGKGANQAVAAALAGAATAIAGQVGDDEAGAIAVAALREHGVDTSLVECRPDAATGSAWITVAENDNKIIIVGGANADWPAGWPIGDAAAALRAATVVLCQLEIPLDVVLAAAVTATGRFVLNPSPATVLPASLLAACDVLVVNEHELAVVAGDDRRTLSRSEIRDAHARLCASGVGAVVTTLGAKGAVVGDEDGSYDIPSPPASVVDTTGAGDAFAGVLCARLAGGAPLRDAVRWAATAGSLAVRSAGTFQSYPDAATLAAAAREAP